MQSVKEVFSDSDESDDLDMGNIVQKTPVRSFRDVYVSEENRFHISRHQAVLPETTNTFRLPAAFGIQTKPFDAATYSEEAELQELAEKKRLSRSEALIRWRWKRDENGNIIRDARGNPIRESNTRIVKWSDGTYQLLIGDNNVFDIRMENNVDNVQYVAAVEKARNDETQHEEDFYRIQSHLNQRLVFQPRQVEPVPKSVLDTEYKGVDYELRDPVKATRRRKTSTRNHAVQNTEMDSNFVENNDDNIFNVATIKRKTKEDHYQNKLDYYSDYSD